MPLVAATLRPLSSARLRIGESLRTSSAVHSGRLATYTVRTGLPLARASTAARPAVEAKSTLPALRYSRERLLPWLNTQRTRVPLPSRLFSSQPNFLSARLVGA